MLYILSGELPSSRLAFGQLSAPLEALDSEVIYGLRSKCCLPQFPAPQKASFYSLVTHASEQWKRYLCLPLLLPARPSQDWFSFPSPPGPIQAK
jgi:hypothetical protein